MIVHHAGNSFGRQHGFAEIEKMHTGRFEKSKLGFHTFYNYVIEPDGLILHPREIDSMIHVCLVGGGDYREFTEEQLQSLEYLLDYHKDPITYHNKYSDKTCPGAKFPYERFKKYETSS